MESGLTCMISFPFHFTYEKVDNFDFLLSCYKLMKGMSLAMILLRAAEYM